MISSIEIGKLENDNNIREGEDNRRSKKQVTQEGIIINWSVG